MWIEIDVELMSGLLSCAIFCLEWEWRDGNILFFEMQERTP